MKSLEILDELIEKEFLCFGTSVIDEEIEIIKADLEVLEMIKKGIVAYQDKFTTALEAICAMFDFNEEEYNKLKQWLEENE